MGEHRAAVLIPTYDNPATIRAVVEAARRWLPDVLVVDDGSAAPARLACEALMAEGLAHVHRRPRNGGKGAAVKTGFEVARERGYSHVVQVDGDGQHDLSRIAEFLEVSREQPGALIMAYPEYDDSVPRVRRVARGFTRFWVDLEAGRGVIRDAMVGFRVYPLAPLADVPVRGNRMDFDVEIGVRAAWAGIPIVNLPVKVRYPSAEEGGVSHFRMFGDNLRLSWLHSRLCTIGSTQWILRRLGWRPRRRLE